MHAQLDGTTKTTCLSVCLSVVLLDLHVTVAAMQVDQTDKPTDDEAAAAPTDEAATAVAPIGNSSPLSHAFSY